MRWFFGMLGLFALVGAVTGAIFFAFTFAIYSMVLTPDATLLLIVFVLFGGIWLVERAWRKIIGATDDR